MNKNRMEAFSDGVIAIIITIMVLELKVPHNADFSALSELLPVFLSYVMSFVFIAIYWGNHHHLIHLMPKSNGRLIWYNNHLLFWLSLIPFVTGWMGENQFAPTTVALYGFVALMAGLAYRLLQVNILCDVPKEAVIHAKMDNEKKGLVAMALYAIGIGLSFVAVPLAVTCYVAVSVIYFIPDRRIEHSNN